MVDAESINSRLERLDDLIGELDAIRAAGHDAYMDVDDEAVWNALARLDDLRELAAAVQRMTDSAEQSG